MERRGLTNIEKEIEKIVKPLFKKKDPSLFLLTNFIKNWDKIIGEKLYQFCYPQKIKLSKKSNILYIKAFSSSAAFFIESNNEKIIDNISSYFGYKIISDIKIEQSQSSFMKKSSDSEVKISDAEKEKIVNFISKHEMDDDMKKLLFEMANTIFTDKN